jgi:hypothetical protein
MMGKQGKSSMVVTITDANQRFCQGCFHIYLHFTRYCGSLPLRGSFVHVLNRNDFFHFGQKHQSCWATIQFELQTDSQNPSKSSQSVLLPRIIRSIAADSSVNRVKDVVAELCLITWRYRLLMKSTYCQAGHASLTLKLLVPTALKDVGIFFAKKPGQSTMIDFAHFPTNVY